MSDLVSVELTLVTADGQKEMPLTFEPDETVRKKIDVATGVSDQEIDISEIATGSMVLIQPNKAVTIKLADGGTAFAVAANKVILVCANVAGVYVSNSSGSTASIFVYYIGT